ncbi:MAG TPA: lycopene cyclase family protein [Chitinophagaceae bacterium]|nr:lycopene cyclase family protein [Chitinophagaceae bacterium]
MKPTPKYDYIIAGAGCAGLSLLMRMIRTGLTEKKRILLIDRDVKQHNDRTWCFWEQGKGFFEPIVYRQWGTINFFSRDFSKAMTITPYRYKMIRGIDFYRFCFEEIDRHPNIERVYGEARFRQTEEGFALTINDEPIDTTGSVVFNSIYSPAPPGKKSLTVLQHFKGWVIETSQDAFDPSQATMMDFRVHQRHGTSFAYVLPFSSRSALVEYTLFTPSLLKPEQYNAELRDYIGDFLGITGYDVIEEEFGIIPMTNEKFHFKKNGWQIGTAGGQTKASSGYTFQFIQKQSDVIVSFLLDGKRLDNIPSTASRFRFYDNTLLYILYHGKLPGDKIFSRLFQKNKPQQVLRFLDNESSLAEELKIISTLPTWPFLKAALKQF